MKIILSALIVCLFSSTAVCQSGMVTGSVKDKNTLAPLVGVSIVLEGSEPLIAAATDVAGNFKITAPIGTYTLKASYVGYQELRKFNSVLTAGNTATVNFELTAAPNALSEVVVTASPSTAATAENPLSIQRLSAEEIKSNPGGNFDISRVIQSLPGVSTSVGGVRNDIIIRGGAPNENVYYLDGVEVPVINHFTTQGSAGGPQGILNVSFIEDVVLSTSAFHARYGNALSSVFQFKQREGNSERLQGNIRLSGTELATTLEGPLSQKTTFLASARRSYLQYFFQLIDLPIRPSYWDFQFKLSHKFNAKTSLTALGIGALDEFSFAVPEESTPEKEYVLRSSPLINQNTYTVGVSLQQLINNGYVNVALSRNYFENRLDRFEDGQNGKEAFRSLESDSDEIENKLRLDVNKSEKGWKYSYGLQMQWVQYNNDLFTTIRKEIRGDNGVLVQPGLIYDFDTALGFFKYGGFVQATKLLFNNSVSISGGIRTDMNSFMEKGSHPLRTLSPRLAISYALTDRWNINAAAGRYYKLPVYTVLGFRNQEGDFVNKNTSYIQSAHYGAGMEFLPGNGLRFTAEGFFKRYADYPVSDESGVSLANEGAGFGAIGNEPVSSTGKGRTYGIELFAQKNLTKSAFYVVSYTWYRSEFTGADSKYIASSWDNQHLLSALLGRKFSKGWEMGLKYRYSGGAPYTPLDLNASRLNYLSLSTGVRDTDRLNSERLPPYGQLDLRLDKKWNYRRLTLDLFLDVQNVLLAQTPAPTEYTFDRNEDGTYKTTDGNPIKSDGSNAVPYLLENDAPFFVPTVGFILEF